MTTEFVCRNLWGMSELTHIQSTTTSIALMFMQRKTELFWFYSEAFWFGAECLLAAFQHYISGLAVH